MGEAKRSPEQGPFRAEQLSDGDRYELASGHAIYCAPSGARHGGANAMGALVLGTDPKVTEVGIDVGYSPKPDELRAPDVSVGNVPDAPGWVKGAPPLAVEYADRGTDEQELEDKIQSLLKAGTRWVWVVRLTGERRVQVFEADKRPPSVKREGELLEAPGVLANSVPVSALFDREAALDASVRNLLQRGGLPALEQALAKSREDGIAQGIEKGIEQGIEQGIEKGIEKGIEQGIEKGIEKGIEQGIERGRIEGRVEGQVLALRASIATVCATVGIALDSARQARLAASSVRELEALFESLVRERAWPEW